MSRLLRLLTVAIAGLAALSLVRAWRQPLPVVPYPPEGDDGMQGDAGLLLPRHHCPRCRSLTTIGAPCWLCGDAPTLVGGVNAIRASAMGPR